MNHDQNPHKLILLRGNSGSGKTTLAHMLQHKLGRGTLVISQDVIRRDMLWAKDTKDGPAVPLLINLVQYGRRHCDYVILEGILFSETYEALFHCIQSEYAAENIHAYYYDIPFEETLRRHETKPNRADFGPEAMRDWWKEKDYIGYLPEKILTQTMTLEDAAAQILADVQGAVELEGNMIVWINGAYGVGKSTTAEALHKRIDDSFIFDPEMIGNCVRETKPDSLWRDDFQDYPSWRQMTYLLLKELHEMYAGTVIVPMTILNPGYCVEVIDRLRKDGIQVCHFILEAAPETIGERILARKEDETCWCYRQIPRCVAALRDDISGITINTDQKSVDDVVSEILNALKYLANQ